MKKLAITALALSFFAFDIVQAESLVSIDGIQLMQRSKEGQEIAAKMQKKVDAFHEFVEASEKTIAKLQEEIRTKGDLLSPSALEEKRQLLAQEKKAYERTATDMQEELRNEMQRAQIGLSNKHLVVANKLCLENNWDVLIDKNANGVLFVAKAIDKTDEVLARVNEEFDAAQKKAAPVKAKKEIRTA